MNRSLLLRAKMGWKSMKTRLTSSLGRRTRASRRASGITAAHEYDRKGVSIVIANKGMRLCKICNQVEALGREKNLTCGQ